jgi:hypothetical protein
MPGSVDLPGGSSRDAARASENNLAGVIPQLTKRSSRYDHVIAKLGLT